MQKKLTYTLLLIALAVTGFAQAQPVDYASAKEKLYVHTNHIFFKPGETMFFKIYVVNAADQRPTQISNVVYAELLNPAGNLVQKLSYRVDDGYAEGSWDFSTEAVGGIYKLRVYTTWMRNENDSNFFVKEVTLQKVIAPRVLLRLDFPEKGYGAGAGVAARFSMRNLSDEPIKNYVATFTVAIAGQVVQTSGFTTDNHGKAIVKFSLPEELNTTDGLLNITVNYDAYTEAISRSIPIVLNKIDLQFMPEGGTLVNGIQTKMAFKAVNEFGKATDVKGEVWDDKGVKVAGFESYHFGMGVFSFTPEAGRSYTAKITSPSAIEQQYRLPAASTSGVVMAITKEAGLLRIFLTTTDDRMVTLTGSIKNSNYYNQTIHLKKGVNEVMINEMLFPTGIAQFSLATITNLPLAERLYFLNENRNLRVAITTEKKIYTPREKVTLTLKTFNQNGQAVPANFSLAVVDDKLWTFADDKQDHILSWLLLSTELKGKIEEPQFYFKKEEPKAVPALDLLMLTHGYRYFDYIEFVVNEGRLKYAPDQDNILSGIITGADGKPVKATVFLANGLPNGKAIKMATANDGLFFFSEIPPGSGYYLFAQAQDKKQRVTVKILQQGVGYNPLNEAGFKPLRAGNALSKFAPVLQPANGKVAALLLPKALGDQQLLFEARQMNLSEVVVTGYGGARKKDIAGAITIINTRDMTGNNNLPGLLQGRVAGLQITPVANPGASPEIRLRGMRSVTADAQPLLIVDGVPVQTAHINTINPADIETVTIVKDASATAMYGAAAAHGAILIESKKFRWARHRFEIAKPAYYTAQAVPFTGAVYSIARRFYSPRYENTQAAERTDFRETIYWNPVVQTNSAGEATVQFYNSDASTTFRAIAEGIGFNGSPGRAEATYAVKNALVVDAKIPPYLTVGDKALLRLVIKNNTERALTLSVQVKAPEQLKLAVSVTSVVVPADSSIKINIPVEAMAALEGVVRFVVEGAGLKEIVSLPVSATGKGFPVRETFAGNSAAQHHFTIGKMVPGSLKANLRLFKNLEGQLLDGIESMLREPYGCFEQTSSTTYPNIYVLKYLKEAGKSNPVIEKKAMDYLERGYKRLIGFETAQDGFEWFGHAPAHEALTAYGLLEFTDMQEFIAVDQKMLDRTKKFLLNRKDGAGGFKLSGSGYDRFASVPNKVANVYIVYALTSAGLGKEIITEYNAAVKKALESNDGYLLSMTALAASNMKMDNDYRALMDAANRLFQKSGLTAETSVVNSSEGSLRVETASLYALALLREASPNTGVIANLVSKILAEKSYYGYGSTQSTVMALKAIVEYSKLAGRLTQAAPVDFTVNNESVTENAAIAPVMREGKNTFTIQYKTGGSNVPYNMDVEYNTFTPPNSGKAELQLQTRLQNTQTRVGETVRMQVTVTNKKAGVQPMAIAKIGIPAGLAAQPWQLKEVMEKGGAAYYEIFDNYLVFYWMGFAAGETKTINLDLKAEVAGTYKGKASTAYLYYTPEAKIWNDGVEIEVKE